MISRLWGENPFLLILESVHDRLIIRLKHHLIIVLLRGWWQIRVCYKYFFEHHTSIKHCVIHSRDKAVKNWYFVPKDTIAQLQRPATKKRVSPRKWVICLISHNLKSFIMACITSQLNNKLLHNVITELFPFYKWTVWGWARMCFLPRPCGADSMQGLSQGFPPSWFT